MFIQVSVSSGSVPSHAKLHILKYYILPERTRSARSCINAAGQDFIPAGASSGFPDYVGAEHILINRHDVFQQEFPHSVYRRQHRGGSRHHESLQTSDTNIPRWVPALSGRRSVDGYMSLVGKSN